jgi:hypothetical protein
VLEKQTITTIGAARTLFLVSHYDHPDGLLQQSKRKGMILDYRAELTVKYSIAQVPINALTAEVGTGTNSSGLPTDQDLTIRRKRILAPL